jgi:crotonobetainyl-CoA:carnitine CoA-transferase CaiB-like acyl-CoA transferase
MRRSFGPELGSTRTTFGKESISLDLSTAGGREIAHKLIEQADVFVNGFRSGVVEKLGLGFDELSKLNPRLVYFHAAGYGVDGPYARRALYAQAAQSVAGSFGRQVGYWLAPERNVDMSVMELQVVVAPRLAHIVDGDSNPALAVFAAMLLGIYHQQRTGEGQFMWTSMIGGNAYAYSDDFCAYAAKPPIPICDDENYGLNALYRVYQTSDGWICLAVTNDHEWASLVEVIGRKDLADDTRFSTAAARATNDDALASALRLVFKERSAAEWETDLSSADVGCVEVSLAGQSAFTSTDPVLRETGLSLEYEHPMFGRVVRAAPPVKFSETPWRVAPPCRRGEHNHTILAELGYEAEAITALEKDGVVFPPDEG